MNDLFSPTKQTKLVQYIQFDFDSMYRMTTANLYATNVGGTLLQNTYAVAGSNAYTTSTFNTLTTGSQYTQTKLDAFGRPVETWTSQDSGYLYARKTGYFMPMIIRGKQYIVLTVVIVTCFCFAGTECLAQREEELIDACKAGCVDKVKELLSHDIDVNYQEEFNKMTALMHASARGRPDIVSLLIKKKADLELVDRDGATALLFACKKCKMDVMHLLVESGAKFSAYYGKNPLDCVIECGCRYDNAEDNARYLIEKFNLRERKNIITEALCWAQDVSLVLFLLSQGANANGYPEVRPLQAAVLKNEFGYSMEIAKILLDNGALVDIEGDDWSPLLLAVKCGRSDMVEFLLSRGANWKRKMKIGHFKGLNAYTLSKKLESQDKKLLEKIPSMVRQELMGDDFVDEQRKIIYLLRKAGAK